MSSNSLFCPCAREASRIIRTGFGGRRFIITGGELAPDWTLAIAFSTGAHVRSVGPGRCPGAAGHVRYCLARQWHAGRTQGRGTSTSPPVTMACTPCHGPARRAARAILLHDVRRLRRAVESPCRPGCSRSRRLTFRRQEMIAGRPDAATTRRSPDPDAMLFEAADRAARVAWRELHPGADGGASRKRRSMSALFCAAGGQAPAYATRCAFALTVLLLETFKRCWRIRQKKSPGDMLRALSNPWDSFT